MESHSNEYRSMSPENTLRRGSSNGRGSTYDIEDAELSDTDEVDENPCHNVSYPSLTPIPHLGFCYEGDVFYQRGLYTEALLYLSRLPRKTKVSLYAPRENTRQSTPNKRKVGMSKLAPVSRTVRRDTVASAEGRDDTRDSRLTRKRQCAQSINAMASNPVLHPTLFHDNVIPTLLSLCRTKDGLTARCCISALCYLSGSQKGRELILQHGGLSMLQSILVSPGADIYNILATFANLSIEDSFESMFVKEKALESMMLHRKASDAVEKLTSFILFNLSCPSYTYPRINDVIRALVDHGQECRDRLLLSQALYNLTATKSNRMKIVSTPDAFDIINILVMTTADHIIRSNALHSLWCLADTEGCRRPLIMNGSVRALVMSLNATTDIQDLRCIFSTLDKLATEEIGCEEMANVGALDSLAHLSNLMVDPALRTSVFKTISQILAGESNVHHVRAPFFELLVSYTHSQQSDVKPNSHHVLHSLGCLIAFTKDCEETKFLQSPIFLPKLMYHVNYKNFEANGPEEYLQAVLLYNLTLQYDPQDIVHHDALARLLYFGHDCNREDIHALACGMLFNLLHERLLHKELVELPGVLDLLVKLLQPVNLDTVCKTLDILCVLLDSHQLPEPMCIELIYGVFPTLVKLCERGDSLINAGCAACFARFGMVEACRVRMVETGLIASLSILAGEDNPETLQLCVSTYSQLSCDLSICRELIEKGIVHSLASLAAAPEENVRRACAIAFCNLSTNEENIVTLVKHGALKALLVISCVKSNDAITRRMCMKAVMNLMRAEVNIPTMCSDGLPWAFTIFAMSSEAQDFPLLADAFCGLSYYKETRKGLAKATTLTCFLQILHRIYDTPSGATMLKGILNLLSEYEIAAPLLHAGLLTELNYLAESTSVDIRRMVAQILTATFQSSGEARSKYMEGATLNMVGHLLKTDDAETKQSCAILLHVLSHDEKTVRVLILNDTMTTVLDTIRASPNVHVMILLMRAIYNISCREDLLVHVCKSGIVSSIAYIVASQQDNAETIAMCAAIMRNLSCEGSCHVQLVNSHGTTLLVDIFNTKNILKVAKEDAAVGVCNLLLGRVNSSVMLSQGALKPILWLGSHAGVDSNILCSAVLRKLAMPPGNIQQLVDEGTIPCVVSLLETTTNLHIKRNCTATFCLLARKSSVKPSLATHGVISLTLDLLEELKRQHMKNDLIVSIEKMCIDLVSTLAEFVRPNVAGEKHLSSQLFQSIDGDDGVYANGYVCEWEQDRQFLVRADDGPLPLAKPSKARQLHDGDIPMQHMELFPMFVQGYSESFTVSRDRMKMRELERIAPQSQEDSHLDRRSDNLDVLRKVLISHSAMQSTGIKSSGWKKLIAIEFSSQKMFPKLRTPFLPLPLNEMDLPKDMPTTPTTHVNSTVSKDRAIKMDPKRSGDGIKTTTRVSIQHAVLGSPIRMSGTPRSSLGSRKIVLAPVQDTE